MPCSSHDSWKSQQPGCVAFLSPWVLLLQSRKTSDSYQIKPINLVLPDNLHVIIPSFSLVEKKPTKLCPGKKDRSSCPPSPLDKFSDYLATSGDGCSKQAMKTAAVALFSTLSQICHQLSSQLDLLKLPPAATAGVGQACVCVSLWWCARSWLSLGSFHLCQGWGLGQLLQGFSWIWDGLCEEQAAAGFLGGWQWSSWGPSVPECM